MRLCSSFAAHHATEMSSSTDVLCMATADASCSFKPVVLPRRVPTASDVSIDLLYCGVCHTDLHAASGDAAALLGSHYPCVPGHELCGVVTAVGSAVTKFAVGDNVGVGCMVDSCLSCAACRRGEEQFCMKQVPTYGGKDRSGRAASPLGWTLGGYSKRTVVHERFVIRIPAGYPLAAAGPIFCAGVTLFDPLRRHGAQAGSRVGIVGLGGLGQMGARLASAMGCIVTVITRAPASKRALAEACGAAAVLDSSDAAALRAAAGTLDLVLDTVPVAHDWAPFKALLAPGGRRKLVLLGLHADLAAGIAADIVLCGASRVTGSGIGGIEATQAAIDFCAAKNIVLSTKLIPVEGINGAFEALARGNDSGERFVIDLRTLDSGAEERCRGVAPPSLGPPPPKVTVGGIVASLASILCCCRGR